MLDLTAKLIEDIGISILLIISILSIVLIGILINIFYKSRGYWKKYKFIFMIFGAFLVHLIFDAFSIFNPTSLILKMDIFADIIVILLILIAFYFLWSELDMVWKHISVFFITIGIIIDILAEIYLWLLLLELIHLILMLGVSVSFYFLIIKFLISNLKRKK